MNIHWLNGVHIIRRGFEMRYKFAEVYYDSSSHGYIISVDKYELHARYTFQKITEVIEFMSAFGYKVMQVSPNGIYYLERD